MKCTEVSEESFSGFASQTGDASQTNTTSAQTPHPIRAAGLVGVRMFFRASSSQPQAPSVVAQAHPSERLHAQACAQDLLRCRGDRRHHGQDGTAAPGGRNVPLPADGFRNWPANGRRASLSVDISKFRGHDRLASYCELAPRNRQSGTSISSVTVSGRSNRRLKNPLVFSCNPPTRTDGRFGEYRRRCRDRGTSRGRALKATARKRPEATYAAMRDKVPHTAWAGEEIAHPQLTDFPLTVTPRRASAAGSAPTIRASSVAHVS